MAIYLLQTTYSSMQDPNVFSIFETFLGPHSSWTFSMVSTNIKQNIYRFFKAIRGLQAAILLDLGNIASATSIYRESLPPVVGQIGEDKVTKLLTYEEVQATRKGLRILPQVASADTPDDQSSGENEKCVPKTHYVTYATNFTSGLDELLASARGVNVDLTVYLLALPNIIVYTTFLLPRQ